MTQAEKELSLRIERTVRAPADRVCIAWVVPETFNRWMDAPWAVCEHEWEGKEWDFRKSCPPPGQYSRYSMFSTWALQEVGDTPTKVTVEFYPQGDDTRLVLIHEGFHDESCMKKYTQAWESCLDKLQVVLSES